MQLSERFIRSESVTSNDSAVSKGGSSQLKKCRICFQSERVPHSPNLRKISGKGGRRPSVTLLDMIMELLAPSSGQPAQDDGFVAPCRCAGSMRWVHCSCLKIWRNTSPRRDSFFKCEQCFTNYKFKRTWITALFCHPLTIKTATFIILTLSLFFSLMAARYFFASVHNYSQIFVQPNIQGRYKADSERTTTEYRPENSKWTFFPTASKTDPPANTNISQQTGATESKSVRPEDSNDTSWTRMTKNHGRQSWGGIALKWFFKVPHTIPSKESNQDVETPEMPVRHPTPTNSVYQDEFLLNFADSPLSLIFDPSLLELLPAAVAILAIISLIYEGAQVTLFLAIILGSSCVGLYRFDWKWAAWFFPIPTTYGIVQYIKRVEETITEALDFIVKRTTAEVENYE